MKIVVMIMGLLLFGAISYFGYIFGIKDSMENTIKESPDENISNLNLKSVDTEVIEDESMVQKEEEDIAVKSSIEEEIPQEELTEEEDMLRAEGLEGDIIENEEGSDTNDSEDIDDIIKEQEALMDEAVKEELIEPKTLLDKEELPEKKTAPILETEEEKIIREEEERNQKAIEAEDNISE